jgi:hypothetical protein
VIADRAADKVTADHLRRDAYVYVRQSTLRQVAKNTTSTDRQYGFPTPPSPWAGNLTRSS